MPLRISLYSCVAFAASMTFLNVSAISQEPTDNLISNGSFENELNEWTVTGAATVSTEGYEGDAIRLSPTASSSAQAIQIVSGLLPTTRYTIIAKVKGTNSLMPPIIGVRNGPQIDKAIGYMAIGEEGLWTEKRFEFFTDENVTSAEIYLQAYQSTLTGEVWIDEVKLLQGRQTPPVPDPDQAPFSQPPVITDAPTLGDELISNSTFTDPDVLPWVLGLNAQVVTTDGAPALRLISTQDTSRTSQSLGVALAPQTTYTITAEARVDSGVIASMYFTSSGSTSASVPISSPNWSTIELTFSTSDSYVEGGKLTLENWKNQPGAAYFRNVQMPATGEEWTPTTHATPEPITKPLIEDFSSGELSIEDWLVSEKGWGGDNGGVTPKNVSLVDDVDLGIPIKALRLAANGDHYTGPITHNGRSTRVGSAIATRQYFASGRYEVRARVAPEIGVCTAFWPFHYIDYYPSQAGYWHEPNPRRNTEIDWEFPTDLQGGDSDADAFGLNPVEIAYTNARTNSWGGQFGGEGGEHKGRRVLRNAQGDIVDVAQDSTDGLYHTYTIEWHSGTDLGDGGDTRDPKDIGYVRWYFDDVLIDELTDVSFGQGNVPFRAARFWLGVWFPASGYADHVGWAGSPNFDSTALYIASIKITPFLDSRDAWEPETVPNLAWASPDAYPDPIDPIDSPCRCDFDLSGDVGFADFSYLLVVWGTEDPKADLDNSGSVDLADFSIFLLAFGQSC
ncbi:MAG: carbohydrate binding domain-containing protein [Phycisphaerales bacterium]|nr:carbohydrate binding domain-containing protein [Phycisphaerales bacterium]